MIVVFANNQTLVTDDSPLELTTDPRPMGGANFATLVLGLTKLFFVQDAGGGATDATFTYQAEGSNDGQTWFGISGLTETKNTSSAVGESSTDADVAAAFIRMKFTLAIDNATSGDWGSVTLDLHVNLIHK